MAGENHPKWKGGITLNMKEYRKEYRRKNLDSLRINANKYHKTPKGIWQNYRSNAKQRKYDFLLTSEEFYILLKANCYYCGKKEAMGVDRMNNEIGYLSYNVVSCCKTCNFMKGLLDYQSFINHIKSIYNNMQKMIQWESGGKPQSTPLSPR